MAFPQNTRVKVTQVDPIVLNAYGGDGSANDDAGTQTTPDPSAGQELALTGTVDYVDGSIGASAPNHVAFDNGTGGFFRDDELTAGAF